MITKEAYQKAIEAKKEAEETIYLFHRQEMAAFEKRMAENPVFTEDELRFSATARCPCGSGLAYPKNCGMHHYWDCSAILLGKAGPSVKHTDRLPFMYYDVKSESSYRGTTRPSGAPEEA